MARISVVGAGYVGLVSACCFVDKGHSVILRETDSTRLRAIQKGKAPFHEPMVDDALKRALSSGRLVATEDMQRVVLNSDIIFMSVGTPSNKDGTIDLREVTFAVTELAKMLKNSRTYSRMVIRSTVIPGTTRGVIVPILERTSGGRVGEEFGLAVNPEFLREGCALEDTYHPDRIVIGELDTETSHFLENLYVEFHDGKPPPILKMSCSSAEMVKYASNAFLATKVSFINEIANICEKTSDVDVVQVANAIGLDTRIGREFLNAGLGFGGSCFPKDVRALVAECERLDYKPELLKAVLDINDRQALRAVDLAVEELRSLKRKRVAVLGLSFKPETDDIREARSLSIVERLLGLGAEVVAYDPVARENAQRIFREKIEYADSARSCIKGADCCIIVTEWKEFKGLTADDYLSLLRTPVVIDGRRIYDPDAFAKKLTYRAVGLASADRREKR